MLREAPLGTYLGWNITAAGFHKDKICNYAGGMSPFAKTRAERLASRDPRLSLEERYGTHEGYVAGGARRGDERGRQGFLLQADADALIAQAAAGNVLVPRGLEGLSKPAPTLLRVPQLLQRLGDLIEDDGIVDRRRHGVLHAVRHLLHRAAQDLARARLRQALHHRARF